MMAESWCWWPRRVLGTTFAAGQCHTPGCTRTLVGFCQNSRETVPTQWLWGRGLRKAGLRGGANSAPLAGSAPTVVSKTGRRASRTSARVPEKSPLGTAMTRRAGGSRLLRSLLLFVLFTAGVAPFNWDLPEPRSRASKIRVHPRGNLWATGHFMGKKSLEPPSLSLVGTAPPNTQRDQSLQLSHDLLRILLLKKALGMNLSGPASPIQYRRLLQPVLKK
ncbi:neuromedin-B isoform X2 [Peromyscus californicus insignis]|uniref:neuromedin-B isoform X2 n=1 Tax=Peromyscus californicus insignis TaxID=564181 RepID=UPI0022A793B8|nr:neuromedin-B isoform X2 [Peromyscus californicus insignis]